MEKELSALQAKSRSTDGFGGDSFQNRRAVRADQVSGIVDCLGSRGVGADELASLRELQDALRCDQFDEHPFDDSDGDREEFLEARTGNVAPSDVILARATP